MKNLRILRVVLLAGFCCLFWNCLKASNRTLAATQPDVQQPVVISVVVKSLTADVAGAVPQGRNIHVTLVGSPGGRASFTIPNVVENVKMPEVSPGVYSSFHIVRGGEDVNDTLVLAQLTSKDGTMAPLFATPQHFSIDTIKPKLVNLLPADGETVVGLRPILYCGFDDGAGTGVDPSAVRIAIDGRDITAEASVTESGVSYRPEAPLAEGIHTLSILAPDHAGNTAQETWRFTVAAPSSGSVQSLSANNEATLRAGDSLGISLIAAPGGKAQFRIEPLDETFPMTEVQPGQYRGKFTPRAGDSVRDAPLDVRFSLGDKRYATTLDRPVVVEAGLPSPPVIVHPSVVDAFQGALGFEGRAAAHSLVVCTVTFSGESEGGVMPFSGTALTAVTHANGRGEWRMGPFYQKLGELFARNLDTHLVLTAVTKDAAGNESNPVTVRLAYYP